MPVTIYHNPRCSKSRQTLALLEEKSVAHDVVLYLETPPSADELTAIIAKLGFGPRDLMRKGEAPYKDLQLDDATTTEAALIEAMVEHPVLIERPIVVSGDKAAIGRPPESVLAIL
jgi:arsenate reductase (glutaredoxin)